jgi:hypothetical protein
MKFNSNINRWLLFLIIAVSQFGFSLFMHLKAFVVTSTKRQLWKEDKNITQDLTQSARGYIRRITNS